MTKPTDDLEAVRLVTEALQGFDTQDQERILRWAREKLNLVVPAEQPPIATRPAHTLDLAARPAAAPPDPMPKPVERVAVQVPAVEQPAAQPPAAPWQPEAELPQIEVRAVEPPEAELLTIERPAEHLPKSVPILGPEPEKKSRLPMLIGIIALGLAVAFLIFMILSSRQK